MASIHRHRDKYQVRIRRKGLPTITKTFHLLADAKEWATLQERQADRGELGPDRKELERITLADLIDRYLKEVIPRKRHGETDTFALNMVRRHKVAKKRLSDLTPSDFTSYRDERLKAISLATLKRQLTPLRHMFRHARDEWDIPLRDNPLSKVKLTGADKRRERRLRAGELDRLVEAGKKTRNPLIVPIIMFALTPLGLEGRDRRSIRPPGTHFMSSSDQVRRKWQFPSREKLQGVCQRHMTGSRGISLTSCH